ncbi:DNA-binding transcriptional regulator AraC [Capsulimonas corticalis]|uniref:DNA-binding transcriptional regulator AraC n=1 Tax=Capsulimonas corticalis TaxID=2219043 RepID=A0A402CV67_9BACT|nr:helix-turn-helix domain-containing protein [Capsulimonas corticalis]BDI30292.1 DNA-binding transcriptional regulator AraC [Capsulimonas corticalis]
MKREHIAWQWLENNGPIYAGHERLLHGHRVMRPSGTDDWQILATTDGQGVFCGVIDLPVAVGSIVLVPPGRRQEYRAEGTFWEYTWIHFQPQKEWVELMQWPQHDGALMEIRIAEASPWQSIISDMERVVQYSKELFHRKQHFMSNALEAALLQCDLWNPLSRHHNTDPRILAAMDFMRENFDRDISLPDLAERHCMSVSNLSHLFRKHVGIGPMKYLDIQRLEHARAMLENTDEAVNKIASQVGFDFCYFSLHFKKYTMFSPRAYRARFRAVKIAKARAANIADE